VLHDNRVDNFVLLEQRDQLGGRMWAEKLGPFTVEKVYFYQLVLML
jgi:monoamine oxidase